MKPILDFTDKPQQKAFFFDRENRSIGAGGGFNSGKSYAMIAKIHTLLELFHGSLAIIGRKTYSALEKSVVPTYESIALRRNGGKWEGPVIEKFADFTAHYRNGSKLWLMTFDDVKKVRGPNLAFFGISQAEEVAHEIFLEAKGRCRQWNEESIAEWKEKHGDEMMERLGYIPTPFNQVICEFNPAPNWVKKEFYLNEHKANKFYIVPTRENARYHAEGWLEDLKRSYSKESYDRFVNDNWDMFGGMVYPEFDIERLHGIPNMVVPSHWPRIVGWDHGYRNPTAVEAAAIDEMGNVIFYKEHYRDNLTVKQNAAAFKEMARSDKFPVAPDEKFLVFMDYGVKGTYDKDGKTIWDEYSEEGIFGLNPDKDVNAGINMVKQYLKADPSRPFPPWHPRAGQMGSPKMFIVRSECPNLVNEMQMYQWEETKEEHAHQEKPKKWNDHACLDGSTPIALEGGWCLLRWVKEGDKVLTRQGFNKVIASGSTGTKKIYEVTFSDGNTLKGTSDHPVWIHGYGFLRIDALSYGMMPLTLQEASWWNPSRLKASFIGAIQKAACSPIGGISNHLDGTENQNTFIVPFGNIIVGKFRKAITSTTKTATRPITLFQTWLASKVQNIFRTTAPTKNPTLHILPGFAPSHWSGIEVRKAVPGIPCTEDWLIGPASLLPSPAAIVEKNIPLLAGDKVFVQTTANQLGAGNRVRTILKKLAPSALRLSFQAAIARLGLAHVHVVSVCYQGQREVFNLTVEGSHEYFANGFLTHNCDASRYVTLAVGKQMAPWIKPPPTLEQMGNEAARLVAKRAFERADPDPMFDPEGGQEWP